MVILQYSCSPSKKRHCYKWIGQKQKWFAFRFHGEDKEINLKIQDEQEFSEWKWVPLSEIESKVIPFKTATYNRIAKDFMKYRRNVNILYLIN